MRKFFTFIARFIASIFAIFFVITTILVILLTTLERQLFNANLYKNALSEQQIYEHLPGILGETITSSMSFNPCADNPVACEDISPELKNCYEQAVGNERYITLAGGQDQPTETEKAQIQACLDQYNAPAQPGTPDNPEDQGGMSPFMKNLSASDWETLIKLVLPPTDLQSMVESALDQVFAYLDGEINTVTLPLTKIRERLTGPAGTEFLKQLLHSQPACTEEELARINLGLASGEIIYCNPPDDETLNTLLPILQEQLNSASTEIPDEAVLIKPPSPGSPNPGSGPFGADPITTIRVVRLIMRFSPLLPLAFLLLVTLFAVRSLKSWMRWWGIPIFISGAIALSFGVLAPPVFDTAWTIYIGPQISSSIPANIAGIGQQLVSSIIHAIAAGIDLRAIILLAFGLVAWIGSTLVKTKSEPVVPVTPPTPAT